MKANNKDTEKIKLLKENQKLKDLIKEDIRTSTPEKEVFFFEYINGLPSNDEYEYTCKALTFDKRDEIPLLLDRRKVKHHKIDLFGEKNQAYYLNEFLNDLYQKMRGEKETNHRFLVEWTYKDREKKKEDPKLKTSHFFGKDIQEVMDKIEYSVGDDYDPEIVKIELIPES